MAMKLLRQIKLPQGARRALDSPRVAALFKPAYPPHAIEIASRRLVAVAVSREGPGGVRLASRCEVDLPPGLVQPTLLKPAVTDMAAFSERFREALGSLVGLERRISLVLPDRVARLVFVDLGQVGATRSETAELVRWKLKRTTPFRVEDARIAFQAVGPAGAGQRCLVSLVQRQIVEQIEEAASRLGLEVGLVDLASFNVWNLVEPSIGGDGDVLLLSISDDQVTALVARAGSPLFVRSKSPAGSEAVGFEDFRAEIHPTLLYYQDRVAGPGIKVAWVRADEEMFPRIAETLASGYGIEARRIQATEVGGLEGVGPDALARIAPALGAAVGR